MCGQHTHIHDRIIHTLFLGACLALGLRNSLLESHFPAVGAADGDVMQIAPLDMCLIFAMVAGGKCGANDMAVASVADPSRHACGCDQADDHERPGTLNPVA